MSIIRCSPSQGPPQNLNNDLVIRHLHRPLSRVNYPSTGVDDAVNARAMTAKTPAPRGPCRGPAALLAIPQDGDAALADEATCAAVRPQIPGRPPAVDARRVCAGATIRLHPRGDRGIGDGGRGNFRGDRRANPDLVSRCSRPRVPDQHHRRGLHTGRGGHPCGDWGITRPEVIRGGSGSDPAKAVQCRPPHVEPGVASGEDRPATGKVHRQDLARRDRDIDC